MKIVDTNLIRPILREVGYVVTPDGLIKNVLLHERRCAGLNAVIVGDTGTGKTHLMKAQSLLMNANSQLFPDRRDRFCKFLIELLAGFIKKFVSHPPPMLDFETLLKSFSSRLEAPDLGPLEPEDIMKDTVKQILFWCRENDPLDFSSDSLPHEALVVDGVSAQEEVFHETRKAILLFMHDFFSEYRLFKKEYPANPRLEFLTTYPKEQLLDLLTAPDSVFTFKFGESVNRVLQVVDWYFGANRLDLYCEIMMSPRITLTMFRQHVAWVSTLLSLTSHPCYVLQYSGQVPQPSLFGTISPTRYCTPSFWYEKQ